MMNNDDVPRNMPFQLGRKPLQPNTRSSPSPSYNYNYNTNSGYSSQQHMRRKIDRFKRDTGNGTGNGNERLMRQNDLIIRLLKEIRDRLPPPPVSAPVSVSSGDAETEHQNGQAETADTERQAQPQAPEAVSQGATTGPAVEALQAEPQPLTEGSRDGE
jgi:hypothetical protein